MSRTVATHTLSTRHDPSAPLSRQTSPPRTRVGVAKPENRHRSRASIDKTAHPAALPLPAPPRTTHRHMGNSCHHESTIDGASSVSRRGHGAGDAKSNFDRLALDALAAASVERTACRQAHTSAMAPPPLRSATRTPLSADERTSTCSSMTACGASNGTARRPSLSSVASLALETRPASLPARHTERQHLPALDTDDVAVIRWRGASNTDALNEMMAESASNDNHSVDGAVTTADQSTRAAAAASAGASSAVSAAVVADVGGNGDGDGRSKRAHPGVLTSTGSQRSLSWRRLSAGAPTPSSSVSRSDRRSFKDCPASCPAQSRLGLELAMLEQCFPGDVTVDPCHRRVHVNVKHVGPLRASYSFTFVLPIDFPATAPSVCLTGPKKFRCHDGMLLTSLPRKVAHSEFLLDVPVEAADLGVLPCISTCMIAPPVTPTHAAGAGAAGEHQLHAAWGDAHTLYSEAIHVLTWLEAWQDYCAAPVSAEQAHVPAAFLKRTGLATPPVAADDGAAAAAAPTPRVARRGARPHVELTRL